MINRPKLERVIALLFLAISIALALLGLAALLFLPFDEDRVLGSILPGLVGLAASALFGIAAGVWWRKS